MFLILAGITLHVCIFGLLYRPLPVLEDENRNSVRKTKLRRNSSVVENNWSFFKIWQFYIIAANNFLFAFGASIVYGHLGAYAHYQIGLGHGSSASLYSIIGVSVTIFKILQGIVADYEKRTCLFRPITQYILFYLMGGVATLLLPFNTSFPGLVVFGVVFGAGYAACGGSLIPALLIALFRKSGKDQLGLTYGVVLATMATGHILGAPAAGESFDHLDCDFKLIFSLLSYLSLHAT